MDTVLRCHNLPSGLKKLFPQPLGAGPSSPSTSLGRGEPPCRQSWPLSEDRLHPLAAPRRPLKAGSPGGRRRSRGAACAGSLRFSVGSDAGSASVGRGRRRGKKGRKEGTRKGNTRERRRRREATSCPANAKGVKETSPRAPHGWGSGRGAQPGALRARGPQQPRPARGPAPSRSSGLGPRRQAARPGALAGSGSPQAAGPARRQKPRIPAAVPPRQPLRARHQSPRWSRRCGKPTSGLPGQIRTQTRWG